MISLKFYRIIDSFKSSGCNVCFLAIYKGYNGVNLLRYFYIFEYVSEGSFVVPIFVKEALFLKYF